MTGFQGSAEQSLSNGFLGKFVWRMKGDAFGGFSAIEVMEGGQRFVALSDRAALVTGTFERDGAGRITGISAGAIRPLIARKSGAPLVGRQADSEGLAIDDTGQAFVSFENRPRVARLYLDTAAVTDMKKIDGAARLPRNGAFEALAVGDGPTLYAIPEDPPTRDIPVYRWADGAWDDSLRLPRNGSFQPVAADIGPDGRFYLLERDFRGIGGFASRLRRFDLDAAGLSAEATLIVTPFAAFDNLEGLSIWRDGAGRLRATMISDDNFFVFQQTQIVEFQLPD